jgi:hypothetical protein
LPENQLQFSLNTEFSFTSKYEGTAAPQVMLQLCLGAVNIWVSDGGGQTVSGGSCVLLVLVTFVVVVLAVTLFLLVILLTKQLSSLTISLPNPAETVVLLTAPWMVSSRVGKPLPS